MDMQVVLYSGQVHLDTEFFDDLPKALIYAQEAKTYATGFNIWHSDGKITYGKYLDNGSLHLTEG